MKLALLILFNLVTAVAGHFVNRRWDKAFLLFVLMLMSLSLPWFYFLTLSTGLIDPDSIEHYPSFQLAVILGFLLLSSVLFVIDFHWPGGKGQGAWTKTMTFAAAVFCLVSTFYLGWFVTSYLNSVKQFDAARDSTTRDRTDSGQRVTFFENRFFNDYIYFSFDDLDVHGDLPAPPAGDAVIYGSFVRDGAPVEGIELDVVLSEGFKVESLVTDADGRFSFSIMPGTWKIRALLVSGWSGKPPGEFIIVTGREATAGDKQYHKDLYASGELTVDARSGSSTAMISMEINPAIEIVSPARRKVDSVDDPGAYNIEWQQDDRSAFYLVGLSKVTEEGTITSFHPVAQLKTENLSMELSSFTLFDDPGVTNTYSVNLFAFDQAGNFVSESKHLGHHMFTLSGFKVAGDEVISQLGGDISPQNYEEFYQNNKRIAATETLIENGLVAEAEKMVGLITENSRAGKIDALKGYIFAVRGDCARARQHFDQAVKIGGDSCLPKRYRQNCL